jgi:LPS sulfotransferase NodH
LTAWDGLTRPTPDDVRSSRYDTEVPEPLRHKLIICSSPRTSSKRLARLLLAAGVGVPMEYLNERSVRALTARWRVDSPAYLEALYRRRVVNGVFALTVQHHQLRAWRSPAEIQNLFAGATAAYLTRSDRDAQAASLAACMLTDNWGFDGTTSPRSFPRRQLQQAAQRAIAFLEQERLHWDEHFNQAGSDPLRITDEQVIGDPLSTVRYIAGRLGAPVDADSLERMVHVDTGAYAVDLELKSQLLELVRETRSEA